MEVLGTTATTRMSVLEVGFYVVRERMTNERRRLKGIGSAKLGADCFQVCSSAQFC